MQNFPTQLAFLFFCDCFFLSLSLCSFLRSCDYYNCYLQSAWQFVNAICFLFVVVGVVVFVFALIFGAQFLAILTHRPTTRRRCFNSCSCPLCIIRHWQNNLCAFAAPVVVAVSVVVVVAAVSEVVVVAVAFFCHGHLAFYAYALDQKEEATFVHVCVCVS